MGVHFIDRLRFGKPTAAAAVRVSFPSPPCSVGGWRQWKEEGGKGRRRGVKKEAKEWRREGTHWSPQVTKSQKSAPCRSVPSLSPFPSKSQSRKLENSSDATGKVQLKGIWFLLSPPPTWKQSGE